MQYLTLHRFPCARWLGRDVDDGSTERLLVGEVVRGGGGGGGSEVGGVEEGRQGGGGGLDTPPPHQQRTAVSRQRSPSLPRRGVGSRGGGNGADNPNLKHAGEIQESLGTSNLIAKLILDCLSWLVALFRQSPTLVLS